MAVILDVVYNHLGPDGNYLGCYHPEYSNARHRTPWGSGPNFETPPVRKLFSDNAPYWMREFHIDGFRLDATHAIRDESPQHILAEIAERVQELGGFVVAEDDRNEPALLAPRVRGGLGFDGAWADDFHHVLRVMLTGEQEAYYANFSGTPDELAQTLVTGWLFCGQQQRTTGCTRGGDPRELSPAQFIYCISNHDQVGNRAFGERLSHLVSGAAYRAASALLCLVPQTPMLFMGQEFGASSPFQFFNDHTPELAQKIAEGRRREFEQFAAFRDPDLRETIPDPHAETTFQHSKLRWQELLESQHAQVLLLYQEFLGIRRANPVFRDRSRGNWTVTTLDDGIVALVFDRAACPTCVLLVDLIGGHKMPELEEKGIAPGAGRIWQSLLSSNEPRFGGDNTAPFSSPTTLFLQAV